MKKKQMTAPPTAGKRGPDDPDKSYSAAVRAMGKPKPKVDKEVKKYAKSLSKADKDVPPKIKK
jgi:hypothetical protein